MLRKKNCLHHLFIYHTMKHSRSCLADCDAPQLEASIMTTTFYYIIFVVVIFYFQLHCGVYTHKSKLLLLLYLIVDVVSCHSHCILLSIIVHSFLHHLFQPTIIIIIMLSVQEIRRQSSSKWVSERPPKWKNNDENTLISYHKILTTAKLFFHHHFKILNYSLFIFALKWH